MAKTIRIIPRLDIKGPNLVKGIHLEGLRVLGKPEHFSRYYYEQGADELIYMDVVASLYGRHSLHNIIERVAQEIFIPLTVGGGIRTLDDIKDVLRVGADKVSINTAAVKNPLFVREAAQRFGSSTIVVTIEAIKQPDGRYLAYTNNGREYTGIEVLSWAQRLEEMGAGEIMVTSVDREGAGNGFDIDLVRRIANKVSIPVIASGGAGRKEHIVHVISEGNADAVAAASLFHYDYLKTNPGAYETETEGNSEFLKSKRPFSRIEPSSLRDVKACLLKNNLLCRFEEFIYAV
jgi:cyclase